MVSGGAAGDRHGTVYTFYSFKGGVGRSMALANVACLLAQEGKRVLIVDWDLEAPGLEQFFTPHDDGLAARLAARPGVIDLLKADRPHWAGCATPITMGSITLDIIHSGKASRADADYVEEVQRLNWPELYTDESIRIGDYFDAVRAEWRREYDYILLDSRTGVTDIGDLCTVILPDRLVLLFVTNEQNVAGISDVYQRVIAAHERLPADRARLTALPVLSRDEFYSEYDRSLEWRARAAERLQPLFDDWLPREVTPLEAFQKIFIPYFAIWSFGEALPVIERPGEITNPASINAAYSRIAHLIIGDMNWDALSSFADAGEATALREKRHADETEKLKRALAEKEEEQARRVREIEEREVERLEEFKRDALERQSVFARQGRQRMAIAVGVTIVVMILGVVGVYRQAASEREAAIAEYQARLAEQDSRIEAERGELRAQLDSLANTAEDLRSRLAGAQDAASELDRLKQENAALSEALTETSERLNSLTREAQMLRERSAEFQSSLTDREQELRALRARYEQVNDRYQRILTSLSKLPLPPTLRKQLEGALP